MSNLEPIKKAPIKLLTTHNTDNEIIVQYLLGNLPRTELSPKLQQKVDRMYICADLIRTWGTRLRVEPMLIKYIREGTGEEISRQTARNIFDDTQMLFGATQKSAQQFWVDILMGELMADKKAAKAAGDFRAVASLDKVMKDTIKDLMGSVDASIYDRIQPPRIILGYFPEDLNIDQVLPKHDLDKLIEKLKQKKRQKLYDTIQEAEVITNE